MTFAPALVTSTRSDAAALRRGDRDVVCADRHGGDVKVPRASVRARSVRLAPVAVTAAPLTGWLFAAVTVPESTAAPACASAHGPLASDEDEG